MTDDRLELLADDFLAQASMDILRSEKKVNVEVYFDNSDIRSMILGIRAFEYAISKEKMLSAETLVHSLAYFGWIENIRMLAPHQDELLDYLSKKHLLPIYTNQQADKKNIDDLLHAVDLLGIGELKKYIDAGKIKNYLNGIKHKSVELFKVNYFLKDFNWIDRLKKIISFKGSSVVRMDELPYDFSAVIHSKIFKEIIALFNQERESRGRNNFRDALALALIKEKVDAFNSGSSNTLPLFYATTSIIRGLRKNKQIYNQFILTVQIGEQKKAINALRDSYFFILDVSFNMLSENKDSQPNEFFEKVRSFKNRFSNMSFEELSTTSSLSDEVEELLFRDRFFIDIWFNKIDSEVLSQQINDLVSYDKFKTYPGIKQQIQNEIKEISDRLSEKLGKLNLTTLVWETISEFPGDIKKLFTRQSNIDVFSEIGMTRFSLEDKKTIQEIFNTIVLEGNEKKDNSFYLMQSQVTSYIVNGIFDDKLDELTIGISIFWIFRKYSTICKILEPLQFEYGDHFQLALLHAASVFHSETPDKKIVDRILNPYLSKPKDENTYKLWIATGFIYYQMWKNGSNNALIPEDNVDEYPSSLDTYIDKAILLQQDAYDWLRENKGSKTEFIQNRQAQFCYALNNLLYFKVRREIYSKSHISSWKTLADELYTLKGQHPNHWQYRYDHTLALYEYRIHKINKLLNVEEKNHIKRAHENIKMALEGVAVIAYDYDNLFKKIEDELG